MKVNEKRFEIHHLATRLRKLVLQVVTQTEASNENNRVGIARNEPNRSTDRLLLDDEE